MVEKSWGFGESKGYFESSLFFAFGMSSDPRRNLISFYETRFRYVPIEKVDRQKERKREREREREGGRARLPSYWKVNIWQEDGGRVECQKRDVRQDVAFPDERRSYAKITIICWQSAIRVFRIAQRDYLLPDARISCLKKISRWETLRGYFFAREQEITDLRVDSDEENPRRTET